MIEENKNQNVYQFKANNTGCHVTAQMCNLLIALVVSLVALVDSVVKRSYSLN
jgi:hypothetical protein